MDAAGLDRLLGRLTRERQEAVSAAGHLAREFARTLALLRRLQAGEVRIEDVVLEATGWSIREGENEAAASAGGPRLVDNPSDDVLEETPIHHPPCHGARGLVPVDR